MTDRDHGARDAPADQDPARAPSEHDGAVGVYDRPGAGKAGTSSAPLWMALALIAGGVALIFLFIFIL